MLIWPAPRVADGAAPASRGPTKADEKHSPAIADRRCRAAWPPTSSRRSESSLRRPRGPWNSSRCLPLPGLVAAITGHFYVGEGDLQTTPFGTVLNFLRDDGHTRTARACSLTITCLDPDFILIRGLGLGARAHGHSSSTRSTHSGLTCIQRVPQNQPVTRAHRPPRHRRYHRNTLTRPP